MTTVEASTIIRFRWAMFVAGPLLAALTYLMLPETFTRTVGGELQILALDHSARAAAALGVWMAVWWLSEAVNITVTALLPIVLMPLFGIRGIGEAVSPYAHPIIFLFMGGFLLSLSMQKWGLHKRIAMYTLRLIGTQPRRLVLGFMVATALLSMWVSNTATTLMMLPIALSVLDRFGVVSRGEDSEGAVNGSPASGAGANLAVCLTLGIAYAASIGGLGSPLGSPPNAIALGYLSNAGRPISFAGWMTFGVPLVAVFLPLVWLALTRMLYPIRDDQFAAAAAIDEIHTPLGPMNRGEIATASVFFTAVVLWVFRAAYAGMEIGAIKPFAGTGGDALIAMMAALALFVIPASGTPRRFIMDWQTAAKLPWGVLLLFGGGLSLAGALAYAPAGVDGIQYASFSAYLAEQLAALSNLPLFFIVLATVILVIFLTELTSNTATANTLVPILGALALTLGVAASTLILPAALAATCAFMLPVATPPNAIVYASGHIRMGQMVRAGFVLNLVGIVLITVMMYFLLPIVIR